MKIFIYAATLHTGGGKTLLKNFLNSYIEDKNLSYNNCISCIVPYDYASDATVNNLVTLIKIPKIFNYMFLRQVYEYTVIRRKIKKNKPDVIFCMGNIALPIICIPQIILFHWAYAIYPESVIWKRMSKRAYISRKMRLTLFKIRLKYTSGIIVQTSVAKRRIKKIFNYKKPIYIAPNGVSIINNDTINNNRIFRALTKKNSNEKILLMLSSYYPHKNYETLIEVAEILEEQNSNIKFIITIDESQGRGAKIVLKKISKMKNIKNIGHVRYEDVPTLYSQSDGMILPTLLESYSGTYIEAMYYGKPIFTSNYDFAISICKNIAYYFNPLDSQEIAKVIVLAMNDEREIENRINMGYKYLKQQATWSEISKKYIEYIYAVGEEFKY